jgi:hypothetical protein
MIFVRLYQHRFILGKRSKCNVEMIIKLTLVGLIIVLVAVIALSYYRNKECFEDITNQLNASCTDSCESGIQSKDGSAILIMVKKLNPKSQKDLNPYSVKDRDSITGSLLLQTKSDSGLSTVWRAIPCDKGANPPYTAKVTNTGRLVIMNNADKEVWASSKGTVPNGIARYQLVLGDKMDKKGPTDQLQIVAPLGKQVWSASSPDSPESFKPCDSSDPSDGEVKKNQCKEGQCTFPLITINFMLNFDTDKGILMLHSNRDGSDSIIGKTRDMGQNGPYTVTLTKKGDLTMLNSIGNMVWKADVYRRNNNPKMDGTYRLVLAEDGSLTIRAGNGDGNIIWEATPQPQPRPMPDPRRRRPVDPSDPSDPSTDDIPDDPMSDMGSAAMALKYKSDLLKDLQKVVRNELIANRMTKQLERDDNDRDDDSDAMSQGREYDCDRRQKYRCPKNPDGSCPPVPDLSEYIKKDSIPCFGCSLDY